MRRCVCGDIIAVGNIPESSIKPGLVKPRRLTTDLQKRDKEPCEFAELRLVDKSVEDYVASKRNE